MDHKIKIALFVIVGVIVAVVQSVTGLIEVNQSKSLSHTEGFHMLPGTQDTATLDRIGPNAVIGNEQASSGRRKRAIIFRPLFVYRQQQIKKQKLKAMREQQQQQQQQGHQKISDKNSHRHPTRKPVRFYAQHYPYQRW